MSTTTAIPARLDYRDLVIEDFAYSQVALHERIASLEADVEAYRELGRAAIHALHARAAECDRLRHRLQSLHEQNRELQQSRRGATERCAA